MPKQTNKINLKVRKDGIAVLQIVSGNDFNALDHETIIELGSRVDECLENKEVKALLIFAKGIAFSAGFNVKEIQELIDSKDKSKAKEAISEMQDVFRAIETASKPIIAGINGICLGGGLELALSCHYRICHLDAVLGLPEIGLCIIPGLGGTQRTIRLINPEHAAKLLLGGKQSVQSAPNAHDMGLVDVVIQDKDNWTPLVVEFVKEVIDGKHVRAELKDIPGDISIQKILSAVSYEMLTTGKSVSAVKTLIDVVESGAKVGLKEALIIEREAFIEQVFSKDGIEGIATFLDKNKKKPDVQCIGDSDKDKKDLTPKQTLTSNDEFSEEIEMMRELVREFSENEILPLVEEMEEAHRTSPKLLATMAELGFFGIPFAEEYGGSGLGKYGYCVLMEELGRAHSSTAVTVGASIGLTAGCLDLYGTEQQKQKYLRDIIGGKLAAFGLTEANAGSDPAMLATAATRQDDGSWIINGTKTFITNGDVADIVVVFATVDPDLGKSGITAFIVESSWPGFGVDRIENKVGIKASRTCSLVFTDLKVPEENRLGELGNGLKIALHTLNGGRLALAAGCLGGMKILLELGMKRAKERTQQGKKLWEYQIWQFRLAEIAAHCHALDIMIYETARRIDRGEDIRTAAAMLKHFAATWIDEAADEILQLYGGDGYMEEGEPFNIARMWRDARINRIFEGTDEIQVLLIFLDLFMKDGKI